MKKRFAAVLAATAVLGVTTAFAANPFSDVEPSHWAYQAVAQLAGQGVVDGYPDGTFKGERNITRFEMAQMVARAMAKQDRVDAEQNMMINRLADEFSSELNSLGVRVSNLENKVGNVKVSGDFRVRYTGSEDKGLDKKDDVWNYRARLNFNAMVNDKTSAKVRLVHADSFGGGNGTVKVDQAFVTHKFGGNAMVSAGRIPVMIGAGLVFDDNADGAVATFGKDVKLTVGYLTDTVKEHKIGQTGHEETIPEYKAEKTLVQVDGMVSGVKVGGFWFAQSKTDKNGAIDTYGFNVAFKANPFMVDAEWITTDDVKMSDAWIAGLGFKAGMFDLKANYFDAEKAANIISTTYAIPVKADRKGWALTAGYNLGKNAKLMAFYGFSMEDQEGNDVADFYRAQLVYKF